MKCPRRNELRDYEQTISLREVIFEKWYKIQWKIKNLVGAFSNHTYKVFSAILVYIIMDFLQLRPRFQHNLTTLTSRLQFPRFLYFTHRERMCDIGV